MQSALLSTEPCCTIAGVTVKTSPKRKNYKNSLPPITPLTPHLPTSDSFAHNNTFSTLNSAYTSHSDINMAGRLNSSNLPSPSNQSYRIRLPPPPSISSSSTLPLSLSNATKPPPSFNASIGSSSLSSISFPPIVLMNHPPNNLTIPPVPINSSLNTSTSLQSHPQQFVPYSSLTTSHPGSPLSQPNPDQTKPPAFISPSFTSIHTVSSPVYSFSFPPSPNSSTPSAPTFTPPPLSTTSPSQPVLSQLTASSLIQTNNSLHSSISPPHFTRLSTLSTVSGAEANSNIESLEIKSNLELNTANSKAQLYSSSIVPPPVVTKNSSLVSLPPSCTTNSSSSEILTLRNTVSEQQKLIRDLQNELKEKETIEKNIRGEYQRKLEEYQNNIISLQAQINYSRQMEQYLHSQLTKLFTQLPNSYNSNDNNHAINETNVAPSTPSSLNINSGMNLNEQSSHSTNINPSLQFSFSNFSPPTTLNQSLNTSSIPEPFMPQSFSSLSHSTINESTNSPSFTSAKYNNLTNAPLNSSRPSYVSPLSPSFTAPPPSTASPSHITMSTGHTDNEIFRQPPSPQISIPSPILSSSEGSNSNVLSDSLPQLSLQSTRNVHTTQLDDSNQIVSPSESMHNNENIKTTTLANSELPLQTEQHSLSPVINSAQNVKSSSTHKYFTTSYLPPSKAGKSKHVHSHHSSVSSRPISVLLHNTQTSERSTLYSSSYSSSSASVKSSSSAFSHNSSSTSSSTMSTSSTLSEMNFESSSSFNSHSSSYTLSTPSLSISPSMQSSSSFSHHLPTHSSHSSSPLGSVHSSPSFHHSLSTVSSSSLLNGDHPSSHSASPRSISSQGDAINSDALDDDQIPDDDNNLQNMPRESNSLSNSNNNVLIENDIEGEMVSSKKKRKKKKKKKRYQQQFPFGQASGAVSVYSATASNSKEVDTKGDQTGPHFSLNSSNTSINNNDTKENNSSALHQLQASEFEFGGSLEVVEKWKENQEKEKLKALLLHHDNVNDDEQLSESSVLTGVSRLVNTDNNNLSQEHNMNNTSHNRVTNDSEPFEFNSLRSSDREHQTRSGEFEQLSDVESDGQNNHNTSQLEDENDYDDSQERMKEDKEIDSESAEQADLSHSISPCQSDESPGNPCPSTLEGSSSSSSSSSETFIEVIKRSDEYEPSEFEIVTNRVSVPRKTYETDAGDSQIQSSDNQQQSPNVSTSDNSSEQHGNTEQDNNVTNVNTEENNVTDSASSSELVPSVS